MCNEFGCSIKSQGAYVEFMFRSAYNSQKIQNITTMKSLLVRKTLKKQSQEGCSFFKGRNIRKFIFNLEKLFGINIRFSCMHAGKFIWRKNSGFSL